MRIRAVVLATALMLVPLLTSLELMEVLLRQSLHPGVHLALFALRTLRA
jgi:hypothetical protein